MTMEFNKARLFSGNRLGCIKAGTGKTLKPGLWGLAKDMRRLQAVNKVEPIG